MLAAHVLLMIWKDPVVESKSTPKPLAVLALYMSSCVSPAVPLERVGVAIFDDEPGASVVMCVV
eukprot:scaffold7193_cov169-Amphora_coffeaeformis.AAC.1